MRPAPRRARPRVAPLPVAGGPAWLVAAGAACLYAALGLARHRGFWTSAYDLGIFHEAVTGWAHLGLPRVPLKGAHEGLGDHFDLLADHFHPVLALWAPTYWIWPHPATLIVDQAVLLGLAVVPVWRFSERRLGSSAAYVVALTTVLAWGLTTAVGFDVHEIAFAVPLIALAVERADAGRWGVATAAVLALLLVKEDLGLLVAAFGLWVVLAHRERWRHGVVLAVAGIAGYWVTVHEIMPAFDHGRAYMYWSYSALGPDLPSALRHVVLHPFDTVRIAFTPSGKARLLALTLLPTGGLALLSPLVVLLVPLLAERLLSSREVLWDTRFHYAATSVPVVMLGSVDALRRASPRVRQWVLGAGLAAAVALTPFFGSGLAYLFTPTAWGTSERVRDAAAAVQVVPRDARVAADARVVPHLVDRCGRRLCPVYLLDGTGRDVARADWVVADVVHKYFPLESPARVRAVVDGLRAEGWRTAWARGSFVVLARPGH